jgi:hypothetical protein
VRDDGAGFENRLSGLLVGRVWKERMSGDVDLSLTSLATGGHVQRLGMMKLLRIIGSVLLDAAGLTNIAEAILVCGMAIAICCV